jgi:hypothetical protein
LFSQEYWHIGAMMMRLRSSSPRTVIGSKSLVTFPPVAVSA